jgi:hypothetical protein
MSPSSIMNVSLAVAFQRIFQVKRNDRLLLPLLQPKVPGKPAVMLIDFALALSPAIKLAGCGFGHELTRAFDDQHPSIRFCAMLPLAFASAHDFSHSVNANRDAWNGFYDGTDCV